MNKQPCPLFSVIVPVWNGEKYIRETLLAIQSQTLADFDVHIVDDCSTDKTVEIINEFCRADERFHLHHTEKNFGGPAGPRNMGVTVSTGNFLAFCDADDVWVKHKLDRQLEAFNSSQADLICSNVRDFVDGDELTAIGSPFNSNKMLPVTHGKLLIKNWIALSTVAIRRNALAAMGGFNTAKSHVAVEDFDMWLRLTRAGYKAIKISAPLVYYRKLPASLSADKNMMVRKAIFVIASDYAARGKTKLFPIIRPLHWLAYIFSSVWMRVARRTS